MTKFIYAVLYVMYDKRQETEKGMNVWKSVGSTKIVEGEDVGALGYRYTFAQIQLSMFCRENGDMRRVDVTTRRKATEMY